MGNCGAHDVVQGGQSAQPTRPTQAAQPTRPTQAAQSTQLSGPHDILRHSLNDILGPPPPLSTLLENDVEEDEEEPSKSSEMEASVCGHSELEGQ